MKKSVSLFSRSCNACSNSIKLETNSKFLLIAAAFGDQVGGLLNSQAECEKDFEATNVRDAVHMEPLYSDSDLFENKNERNAARRNAQTIKSNILKLVHHFHRDDMQAKLHREFRDLANKPSNNEITNFEKQFENMKQLWFTKLGTSMEDHVRMQEQVETSSKRVKELTEQLKVKKDNLEKYVKESKEAKEQARIEIENLKKARTDLTAEKYRNESDLMTKGQLIKEGSEQRHASTMTSLQQSIDGLNADYNALKAGNQTAEKTLLTNYDNADKQYTEALESYDQDMRDKNKERDEFQAELEDQMQNLA